MGQIDFDADDLAPREIPVRVKGRWYVMREATASALRAYKAAMARATGGTVDPSTGKPKSVDIGVLEEADSILLSHCMCEADKDQRATDKLVALSTVQSWPERYVATLVEKLREMSPGLQPAKKNQEASPESNGKAVAVAGDHDPNA